MEPKERRTCGTCEHCEPSEWHCDSKESEYSWMVDVDDVDLPCGGYGYERCTDGLTERYERLVQLAMQMRDWLFYYVETDPGHVVVESDQDEVREIREAFDALVVSVDDRA